MFARIGDLLCRCVKSGHQYALVSRQRQAEKYGLKKGGKVYCKVYCKEIASLSELDEAYDIMFWVEYETGLKNVPNLWGIKVEKDGIRDGCVRLVFAEGYLPGWKVEEKGISSTYVPVESLGKITVEYRYYRESGEGYRSFERRTISREEFLELYITHINA